MPINSPVLLGNTLPHSLPTPQKVDNNSWSQVSAFNNFTSGLRSDSLLYAWGTNNVYQVGDGTTLNKSTPVQISTSSFILTSSGFDHSVAITTDYVLHLWGNAPSILALTKFESWSLIGRPGANALAIRDNGKLFAWGDNSYGQLGDGTTLNRSSPVQIGNSSWAQVASGEITQLAITTDGRLFAWGYNAQGMIGDNSLIGKSSPVQITAAGVSSWAIVAAGNRTAYAIDNTGKLFGWGLNTSYQIGDLTQSTRLAPVQIAIGTSWSIVNAGTDFATAIDTLGQLYIWGNFNSTFTPIPTLVYSWTQVSSGGQHTVALRSDGTVWNWGVNAQGQLGDSTTLNKSSPVQISGGGSFTQVSSEASFTAAINTTGQLFTWGLNSGYQLGNGQTINRSNPVQVTTGNVSSWSLVSVGATHALAKATNTYTYAWGNNAFGQIGDGTTITKQNPFNINEVVVTDSSSNNAVLTFEAQASFYTVTPFVTSSNSLGLNFNKSGPQVNNSDQLVGAAIASYNLNPGGTNPNFTLEAWIYLTALPTTGSGAVIYSLGTGGVNAITLFTIGPDLRIYFQAGTVWSWSVILGSSICNVQINTWHHVAVVKEGAIGSMYFDGTRVFNAGLTATNASSGSIFIGSYYRDANNDGSYLRGYINNLRIVVGTAVYSGASIVVPTSPLTAISGTSLLMSLPTNTNAPIFNSYATGATSSYGIDTTNKLYVWGQNNLGQLGVATSVYPAGDTINRSIPTLIGSSSWLQVSAGFDHVLAIRSDNTLWTWGNFLAINLNQTPKSWIAVSGGATHTLGVDNLGKLWTWGTNAQGELGNLDTILRSSPVQVSGTLSWNSVSAGNSFSLAINNTNQLYGWGFNNVGQVGDNTSINKSSPVLIASGSWSQVQAGFNHGLAITSDNLLYGWGNFAAGQLGIELYSSWRIIAAGLAIRADNTLWSWGSYPGDSTTIVRSSPIQIGSNDWSTIANNFDSSITKAAIKIDGSLWMWGTNSSGQLGLNDTINRSSPTQVTGSWLQVDTKLNFTAAINSSQIMYVWGDNTAGQLGDNTTIAKSSPVLLASPFDTTSWISVTVGESNVAALRSDRIMYTWGLNNFGQLGTNSTINRSNPTLLASPFNTTSWGIVSAGGTHVIALRATGSTIVAFGRNNFGQLGLGASVGIHRSLPTQIGTDSWLQVSAGPNSTYGIFGSPGFTLYAWGRNTNGELGLNDSTDRNAPTVNGGLSWNEVGAGYVIDVNGRAFIWGPINSGIGNFNFTVSSPVLVGGYTPLFYKPNPVGTSSWTSVDAGSSYSIGIRNNGTLWGWGLNNLGQYGNQSTVTSSSPTQLNSFSWNAVATGFDHVLAIRNDTTLWTWGNSASILVPVTQQSWISIGGGYYHVAAIRNDNKLFAWGYGGGEGVLGNGTTGQRSSPVAIGGTSSFTTVTAIAYTSFAKDINNITNVWGWNNVGQAGTGFILNRSNLTQIGVNYVDDSGYSNVTESYGAGYNTEIIPFANTVSNFFNRSTYITVLNNPNVIVWDDADYMCEMWVNPVVFQAAGNTAPLQVGHVSPLGANVSWQFGFNASGKLMFYYNALVAGFQSITSISGLTVGLNQWQHIAFTHTNSTGIIRLYQNGILVASAAKQGSGLRTFIAEPLTIGAATGTYFNGYISNLRIVKGNVVYTGNFLPQTTPLTATQSAGTNTNAIIAGQTSLLLFNTSVNVNITDYTIDKGWGNHAFAKRTNNTVWTWGNYLLGETGVFNPINSWTQIAGSLALRADNTLWSWATNTGDGTTINRSSPVQIGTNEWSSIALIYNSSTIKAAIKTDRTLWMWGDNSRGQLGINDTINRSSPVQVAGSWNQVSSQFSHTAALDSTNIMYVWGNNAFGQLGTNDTINRSSPVLLASPFNTMSWSFVGVGYSHTTALRSDAIIYSWGNNSNGQLGDNTTISKSNPVLLGTGFPTVSWNQVSVGGLHNVARRNNNLLYTWGYGLDGQLGDGTIVTKSLPVQIGASSWIHVTAGRISTFGITVFGGLFAWGSNSDGELGLGDLTQRNSPVQIGTLTSWRLTGIQSVIDNFGRAYIWGGSGFNSAPQAGLLDSSLRNISPVLVGGFVYPIDKYYAPQQLGTSSWIQVSAGDSFSVGVDSNYRLFTWGRNNLGQLGDLTTINKSSPIQIQSQHSWLAASAGYDHTLAIRSDTTLWAWGSSSSLQQRILPTSWGQISGGANHTLAIRSDGRLYAWGLGTSGQLGDNSTISKSSPVQVGAPVDSSIGAFTNITFSSWSVVSAGNNFSLAVDTTNKLYVWGTNTTTNFQLGDPWGTPRSNPVQISIGNTDSSIYTQETYSYDVNTTTVNVPPLSGSPVAGEFGINGALNVPSYVYLNTSFPLRLETNDFTVECWVNWQGSSVFGSGTIYTIIGNTTSGDTTTWELSYVGFTGAATSGFRFAALGTTINFPTGLFQNRWYHIAAVRISGTVVLYLDGVNVASGVISGRISTIQPLRIGFTTVNSYWIGYISNIRIVNGLGVYTGNFTVPTSVLTATQSSGTNIQAITSGQTALLLLTNTASVQASSFIDTSAGDTHGFAELSNGVVYGWGNNNVGQVEPWGDFPSWNMVSASAGQNGTGIAIRNADKALLVWGLNDVGQLGINDTINRSSPTQLGSNSWLQVNSQGRVTAAIRNDNTLWVWGLGTGGRLGINSIINRSSPVQIAESWTSVTIGPRIAAAIRTDGTLWIWGDNPDGTTVQRSSPVQVSGSWSQVTTGVDHILAIDNLGILYAWGLNSSGQLGDGTTTRRATPTLLAAPFATTSFTKVAAGLSQSLAIATDGTLYVWGGNSVGELGRNDVAARSNPVAVGFPSTNYGSWTAIAAGNQTSAGIANNNLFFWGNNGNGLYGDNSTITRSFPLQVNLGYSFTNVGIDVSLGAIAAITRSDGALFITGNNATGGIGDGTTINRSNQVQIGASFTQLIRTPMRIGSMSWNQVSAGTSFSIGINSIGELYSWGRNNLTQLGLNSTIDRNDAIVKITGSSWTAVSAGAFHSVALRSDATMWAWGSTAAIGLSNVTPNSWIAISESASTSNTAAIRSDGTLFVWGNNNIGQVGDGTTINKSSPTQIGTRSNWTQVKLGESFAVARDSSGFAYAWGLNSSGQLGDGTTFNRSSPIQIGNRSYSTVTAGASYALGVSGDNLFAWGINSAGQLGDNTTINKSSPVLVSGPVQISTGLRASWLTVSAGTSHTVATDNLGTIWTWGNNSVFQLGDNTTINKSNPVQVSTSFSFTSVSAGANHSLALTNTNKLFTWGQFTSVGIDVNSWTQISFNDLGSHAVALRSDGSIFTWGLNTSGQLGTGDGVFRSSPVLVQSNQSFIAVGAGAASSYAITQQGVLYAWGLNTSGQVGDNTTINKSAPVQVYVAPNTVLLTFQSTSLVDNSNYKNAITALGNVTGPTIDTGPAPYTGNSVLINAASERVIIPYQSTFNIPPSTNWTFECFVYLNVMPPASFYAIAGRDWNEGFNPPVWGFSVHSTGFVRWNYTSSGLSTFVLTETPAGVVSATTWVHLAFIKTAANVANIYVNGVLQATRSDANAMVRNSGDILIGAVTNFTTVIPANAGNFNGYISDIRITQGVAVYTGAFTTPTRPLTNTQSAGTNISAITYTSFTNVTAGGSHAAAIGNGEIYTWGNNSTGQIGDTATINKSSPVLLASDGRSSFTQISAEGNYTLAVNSSGLLYAWGQNTNFNLADGSSTNRSNMMQVGRSGFSQISAGISHAGAITTTSGLSVWGAGTAINLLTQTFSWSQIASSLATATPFTLALRSDGALYSWGNNAAGQLGDGTTINKSSPVLVPSTWGVYTKISAGGSHSVAYNSDGGIYAWGLNTSGQLGINNAISRSNPTIMSTFAPTNFVEQVTSSPATVNAFASFITVNDLYSGAVALNSVRNPNSTRATTPANANLLMTGDFTIELYIYPTAFGSFNNNCLAQGGTTGYNLYWGTTAPANLYFDFGSPTASLIVGNALGSINTWYHIAITRSGSLCSLWLNGVRQVTTTYSGNVGDASNPLIYVNGDGLSNTGAQTYVSNVRIINGTAIYTTNFTPFRGPLSRTLGAQTVVLALTTNFSLTNATVSNIAAGDLHTSVLFNDGSLFAVGLNNVGQLGIGNAINRSSPVQIGSVANSWTNISAGASFTLALRSDSSLYSWGANASGQLGLGNTINRSSPVQIGTRSFSLISAGFDHALATDNLGAMYGWGNNNVNQVSDFLYSWTLVGFNPDTATYAIWSNRLFTWGFGGVGGLADNTTIARSSPVLASSDSWAFTNGVYGVKTNGTLWAWGNNGFGKLAQNDTIARSSPVQIGVDTDWALTNSIAGSNHSGYILKTNGTLYAVGLNSNGELGQGDTINRSNLVQIPGSWTAVTAIDGRAAAISSVGTLFTWGENSDGQLGLGNTINRSSPVQVLGSWTAISFGGFTSVGIKSGGTLWSWGSNSNGQLGINITGSSRSSPVQIGAGTWNSVSVGFQFVVARTTTSALFSWGNNITGQLGLGTTITRSSPVQIGTSSWSLVGISNSNAVAIDITGRLFSWGNNSSGILGLGDTINRSSPVQVGPATARPALSNPVVIAPNLFLSWSAISAGNSYSLGLNSINIYGWGLNTSGQLGDNTTINKSSPVLIGTGNSWNVIAAGANSSLATTNLSLLFVWGNNATGQLGNYNVISRSSPIMINATPVLTFGEQIPTTIGTSSWSQISVGTSMTMALRADNTLFTWGLNASGQLGLADVVTRSSPVQVLGGAKWSFIQAGLSNAFAISSAKGTQNKLFVWGNDAGALLGFGNQVNRSSPTLLLASTGSVIPSVVLNNVSFNQISAGVSYSIARRSIDNAIMGWNQNSVGQMGDQTLVQSGRSYPVMAGYPVDVDRSVQRWTPSYTAGIKTTDFSPFANQPYNTATLGGSVEFNGVDTFVSYTYTTLFDIATRDVSVEVWAYWNTFTTAVTYMTLYGQNAGASTTIAINSLLTAGQANATLQVRLGNDTFRGSWPIETNIWYHIVVTIQSGNARMFIDGKLILYLATVGSINIKNEGWVFGGEDTGRFNGYMSNFRLVIGEVPTDYQTVQVLGAIDQSSFNAVITDVNSAVTYSDAIIPITGATAAFFPGSVTGLPSVNSYLTIPNAAGFQFGTGDFTVEFFMRKDTTYQSGTMMALNTASLGNWAVIMAGGFFYWQNNFTVNTLGPNLSINTYFPIDTWKHVAIVRISGTINIYIGGVSVANYADTTNYNGTGILNIGSTAAAPYGTYEGYLSNLRIVKGVGVYTGNFTVPTSPLTSTQSADTNINAITGTQTSLLLFTTPASAGTPGVQIFTSPTSPLTQTSQGISSALSTRLLCLQGLSTTYNGVIAATGRVSSFSNNGQLFITGIGTTGEQGDQSGTTKSTAVQLGTVFTGLNTGFNVPVRVTSGSWSQVRAGTSSSVALRDDGTVWTWGQGTSGELGTRSQLSRSNPVQVTTLSTSFIDNSSNNQTLTTVSIDASMVIFSPFATVPYDASTLGGSGYFSNGYLTLASNAVLAMGSGDFTCEAWIYITDFTADWRSIFSTRASSSTVDSTVVWALGVNKTGFLYFYSGAFQASGSVGVITLETWYHVAVTRASNSMRLFVNGVQTGTTTTTSQNYTTQTATIGANGDGSERFFGYISNLRLVKGQALYTANFTPSTTPLTTTSQGAIAGNVSLLTCGSFASAIPTTMNQIAVGTSFVFSRQTSDSSLFAWGTNANGQFGDNTVTAQSSPTAINTGQYIQRYTLSPVQIAVGTSNYSQVFGGYQYSFVRTTNGDLYAWGINTSGRLGLLDTQPYLVANRSNPTLVNSNSYWNLLDVSTFNNVTSRLGTFTTSTSIVPIVGSVSVTGFATTKILVLQNTLNTTFFSTFTTTFTVECWVYVTSVATSGSLFSLDNTGRFWVYHNAGTRLWALFIEATQVIETASPFNLNTWMHIALVRTGGFARLYRDGVQTISFGSSSSYAAGSNFAIGSSTTQTVPLSGYISNFRIASVAVYTGAFTPPNTVLTTIQSAGANISALSGRQVVYLTLTTEAASIQSLYYDYSSFTLGVEYTAGVINGTNLIQSFGAQQFGSLGLGDTITRSSAVVLGSIPIPNTFTTSPVQVRPGTSNYVQVFAGQSYSVAIDSSNTLYGWGLNTSGQLATDNAITRSNPTVIPIPFTILDVSTYNFSVAKVTTNFDTTVVPLSGAVSGSFGGNRSFLTLQSNLAFAFGGSDFAIEFWFYMNVLPTSGSEYEILDMRPTATNGTFPLIYVNTTGVLSWWISGGDRIVTSPLNAGVWYHVAVCRQSLSTKMYIDGTQAGSTYADTNNYSYGSFITIGATNAGNFSLNGYLSNFRMVKGTPVYTGNFTVPTSVLTPTQSAGVNITAITGAQTSLLIFTTFGQSIGVAGSPVAASAGYSHYNFLASDNRIYTTGAAGSGQLGIGDAITRSGFTLLGGGQVINSGTLSPVQVVSAVTSWAQVSAGQSFSLAQDTSGNTYAWGLNSSGQLGSLTTTVARSSPTVVLSEVISVLDVSTYSSNIFKSGTALSTTDVPVPSAIAGTFNGTSDFLSVTPSSVFAFGTGPFTIEAWIYLPSTVTLGYRAIIDTRNAVNQITGLFIGLNNSTTAWTVAYAGGQNFITISTALTQDVWQHIAVVRNVSNVMTAYLNGISVGSGTVTQNFSDSSCRVGSTIDGIRWFGSISNLRVVKGVAVYTGNFTVPTSVLTATQSAGTNISAITGTETSLLIYTTTASTVGGTTFVSNSISAGQTHAAAIQSSNTLYLWGLNSSGQLGNDTTISRSGAILLGNIYNTATISPIIAISGSWKNVSAGTSHTLAIRSDDQLWAWGLNNVGQLGYPDLVNRSSPVQVAGSWSLISAGLSYSLATDMTGLLYGWGLNTSNQLGLGTATNRSSPVLVSSTISWAQIAAGKVSQASYGLNTDYLYYVWGGDGFALLATGRGALGTSIATPTVMIGINWNTTSPTMINGNYTTASAGLSHTGAIQANSLYLWGLNSSGQLGVGNTIIRSSPTLVGATVGISDGSANNYGATITGNPAINIITTPITASPSIYFPGSSTIRYADATNLQFGTGAFTIECFIRLDSIGPIDSIVCKGTISPNAGYTFFVDNGLLQLTIGGSIQVSHPTLLSANIWYYVAVTRDSSNDVRLFVNGVSSGILDNTSYNFNQTTDLRIGVGRSGLNFFNGYISNFRIVKGTALYTANFTPPTSPLTAVAGTQLLLATTLPTNLYSNVFAGFSATLATAADSTLYGFGTNSSGEISGYYSTISRSTPVSIGNNYIFTNLNAPMQISIESWTKVSAGNSVSAAIRSNNTLWTWGSSTATGQLGNNSLTARSSPVQVSVSASWTQVSVFNDHMLALTSAGSLYAWGTGTSGQLGITTITPSGEVRNRSNPTLVGDTFNVLDTSLYASTLSRSFTEYSTTIAPSISGSPISGFFNGTGALSDSSWPNKNFGTGDFTIEFWVRLTESLTLACSVVSQERDGLSQSGWQVGIVGSVVGGSGQQLGFLSPPGDAATGYVCPTPVLNLNTWYHVAFVRISNTMRSYVDGVDTNQPTSVSTNYNAQTGLNVGTNKTGTAPFKGYISNLRIARLGIYTGSFTVPTSLLSVTQNASTNINATSGNQVTLLIYTSIASLSIPPIPSFTQISAGDSVSSAIRSTGGLFTWGNNTTGRLGQNDVVSKSSPVQVGTGSWTSVKMGTGMGAAITSLGSLFIWGTTGLQLGRIWPNANTFSSPVQIGNQYAAQSTTYTQIPFQVNNLSWKSVDAGNSFTSAISLQDRLFAWGINNTGQLDSSNTINRSDPTQIGQNLYLQAGAGMSNMGAVGKAT